MNQVDIAIHDTVHESDMTAKEQAQRLGMSYQVLINKANANSDTHKLTLRESIALQLITGTTAIHEAAGFELGVQSLPKPSDDSVSLMTAMLNAGKENGDISKAIMDSLADGMFTVKEKQHCIEQISEAITALQQLQKSVNDVPVGKKIQAVG